MGAQKGFRMTEPVGNFMVESMGTAARGQNRNSLLVKAMLRFPATGEQGEARVRNISAGGLMAEAPVRAGRGETVEVQLKNIGWVAGKVAWVAESRFGIAFDYPINPKATQQPVGSNAHDETMPTYLRKLNSKNQQAEASKLRRL
jgi:PilZ domain